MTIQLIIKTKIKYNITLRIDLIKRKP